MNRASYKIVTMCRVLGVSTSGYYGWRGREPSVRAQQDALMLARMHKGLTSVVNASLV